MKYVILIALVLFVIYQVYSLAVNIKKRKDVSKNEKSDLDHEVSDKDTTK